MILPTASLPAAVALSGAALTFLAFAASGAPGDPTAGFVFQDEEPGYLGVPLGEFREVPAADEAGFLGINLGSGEGVVVGSVIEGTAATRAKLQAGDRIVAFDGRKIASGDALREAIAARAAGTRVVLEIARGDRPLRIELALGARDASETAPAAPEAAPRSRARSSTRVGAERQLRETMGSLRAEVEGLRRELQALRQALRELRSGR